MNILNEQILEVLKSFNVNKFKYILVGGFATNFHGYDRYTADMDIWFEDTLENRRKLRKALFDAGLGDLEPLDTMQFIPGWTTINLDSGFPLDFMTNLKGLENLSFDECFEKAEIKSLKGEPIRILYYHHLITSKKAANRPKDQVDVIELEKIRRLTEEKD